MAAEKENFPVRMMARLLGVSRQGFYQWLKREPEPDPWAELKAAIESCWLESKGVFGARQVLHSLPGEFAGTTLYRVRKCMREMGICGAVPHKKKRTVELQIASAT